MQALFNIYRRPATALAARICGAELAEDAVQEAFLSIWRSSTTYRADRGEVTAWVLGAVRNRAIDALRRDSRHQKRRTSADICEFAVDPKLTHSIAVERDEACTLRSLLRAIPPDQARVIELAYFDGLSHVEIADRLNLPLGTVKGRIRLGLVKLRHSGGALGTATQADARRSAVSAMEV